MKSNGKSMEDLQVDNSTNRETRSVRDSTIIKNEGTPTEITLRLIKNLEITINRLRNELQEKDERFAYIMVISKEKDESIKNLELIIKRGFKDITEYISNHYQLCELNHKIMRENEKK